MLVEDLAAGRASRPLFCPVWIYPTAGPHLHNNLPRAQITRLDISARARSPRGRPITLAGLGAIVDRSFEEVVKYGIQPRYAQGYNARVSVACSWEFQAVREALHVRFLQRPPGSASPKAGNGAASLSTMRERD